MTRIRDVSFAGDGVTLHGTLHLPDGEGTRPGIVLVHGSGPGRRSSLAAHATAFADAGIVVLSYDKRTKGYSATRRDYNLLADDVLAAVRFLAAQPETEQVGVWGFSEGGWVAPLAAARSDQIAYVVLVGASGVPPARQQAWALESHLRRNGLRGALVDALAHVGIRQLVGAGVFPEAHHDGLPVLRSLHRPVLAVWGEHDQVVPPEESLLIFRQVFGSAQGVTLDVISQADHGMRPPTTPPDPTPAYVELVTSWITGLPATAGIPGATAPPAQTVHSRLIEPLAWWESTPVQCAAMALFVAAFPGYLAGSRDADPAARCAALLGTATAGGWITYFLRVLTAEKPPLGPKVGGRTLPWLALQGTAAGTVVATALTAARARRVWSRLPVAARVRLGLLIAGGAAMVPWGRYWRLLRR